MKRLSLRPLEQTQVWPTTTTPTFSYAVESILEMGAPWPAATHIRSKMTRGPECQNCVKSATFTAAACWTILSTCAAAWMHKTHSSTHSSGSTRTPCSAVSSLLLRLGRRSDSRIQTHSCRGVILSCVLSMTLKF